jgi:hypothetical protein
VPWGVYTRTGPSFAEDSTNSSEKIALPQSRATLSSAKASRRAYVPPRVSFSFRAALLDLSPATVMRFFLQFSGNRGKQCCVLGGRNWEMIFPLPHPPTGRPQLRMTHANVPYQRAYCFHSFPIPLDPPPRSSIRNAIPSASFNSGKDLSSTRAITLYRID